MDVFMVYHGFTSAWRSVWSLRWYLVQLMKLQHVVPCFYAGRLDRLTCSRRCMFVAFVCFACFVHSSVGEPVHLHVFRSLIPFIILTCLLMYVYLKSLMMRWHKIKNLLVYHDTWSFGCRWPREAARLWCGIMSLGNYWWKLCKSH